MKARFTLLITFVALNCLSCSQENEMDKAIDEALREADFDDQPLNDDVSIKYYVETKDR